MLVKLILTILALFLTRGILSVVGSLSAELFPHFSIILLSYPYVWRFLAILLFFTISTILLFLIWKTKRVFTIGIIVMVIAYSIWFAFLKDIKDEFVNRDYRFMFTEIEGWEELLPQTENVKAFLVSKKNSVILSTAQVAVAQSVNLPTEKKIALEEENCYQLARDSGNTIIKELSGPLLTKGKKSGYQCTIEAMGENLNQMLLVTQYSLLNRNEKFDYILTTSYPKGDQSEAEKVKKLVDHFFAY